MFPAVARALCQLLAVEIAPLYRHLYPQSVLAGMLEKQTAEGANGGVATLQLSRRALDVLRLLGHHLYHDVATLTRLTRITASAVLGAGKEAAVDVLSAYIMPAAMMIPSNSALVLEVWNVLKQLPYTERFCLYFDLKEATSRSLLLTASAKLAETEVRRVLRRVTAPANKREAKLTVRPLSRMLAKIANANPLAVSQQLLRQVMGMPGMVISITEALKFMAPPAFDVTTYAIIAQLASGKKKLKEDGINLEEWFQWLAAFTGMLCRKNE